MVKTEKFPSYEPKLHFCDQRVVKSSLRDIKQDQESLKMGLMWESYTSDNFNIDLTTIVSSGCHFNAHYKRGASHLWTFKKILKGLEPWPQSGVGECTNLNHNTHKVMLKA